jgi:hypothetical protein
LIVAGLRYSSCAISAFDSPRATCSRTSSSRSVSSASGDYEGARGVFSVAPGARGTERLTLKLDPR